MLGSSETTVHSEGARGRRKASRDALAVLLRSARRTIDPKIAMLGPFRRLENRIGLPVTQEEVAEACGISRQWYAYLERGGPINPSVGVLTRVAETLMLSSSQRDELFELAIPELRQSPPRDARPQTSPTLNVIPLIANRLLRADSEREVLGIIAEALYTLLPASAL